MKMRRVRRSLIIPVPSTSWLGSSYTVDRPVVATTSPTSSTGWIIFLLSYLKAFLARFSIIALCWTHCSVSYVLFSSPLCPFLFFHFSLILFAPLFLFTLFLIVSFLV